MKTFAIAALFVLACAPAHVNSIRMTAEATRGRQAFIDLHCHACHRVAGDDALPKSTLPGPRLHDLNGLTPESVANKIVSRSAIDAEGMFKTSMADFAAPMTGAQLDDVVAYLRSGG